MDPVVLAVLTLAGTTPFGDVVELGCGRGQLSMALLEAGLARSVLGLDRDAAALDQLRWAAEGLDLRAMLADLTQQAAIPEADTILLIDVLYQLPTATQLDVLRSAAGCARRTLVIRTTDPAAGWRSAVSRTLERLGRGIWPTFGERINPLPLAQLAAVLEERGFAVEQARCAKGTPLAGVLLVARAIARPAQQGATPRPVASSTRQ